MGAVDSLGDAMSDTRTIAKVVFTPTGEKPRSPLKGEWFLSNADDMLKWPCDGPMSAGDRDIYTREVIYEEQESVADLRGLVRNAGCDSPLFRAIIDQLEAQERRLQDVEQWIHDVRRGDL